MQKQAASLSKNSPATNKAATSRSALHKKQIEIDTAWSLFGRPDVEALWRVCGEASRRGSIARISLALRQAEQSENFSSIALVVKEALSKRLATLQAQEALANLRL